ncbi:unnamed protein product [Medioppia subpectinata]|uniref:SH2 domain-containing protein n=1 Tax=Medioppia subpectinata TaxID=1979941 RepID=A0A7R9KCK6_9ACAR|nr:unnamed protein product [Medioppia subpectinata]CAG2100726.1 unnamed protein product [Medioppia subpectinata]
MPSPLNTPTNERQLVANELWTIKTPEGEMNGLELSAHSNDGIDSSDSSSLHITSRSNPLMTTINEENNQNISSESKRMSRMGLNLDLSDGRSEGQTRKKISIGFGANGVEGSIGLTDSTPQAIDVSVPVEKQGWFHGYISRTDGENVLRTTRVGSYLVRHCSRHHYSLSLKCVRGFMHIKIVRQSDGTYTFGTENMSFNSIPHIVNHYCYNRLPIVGAEHMSLLYPVIDQLL